MRRRSVEPEPPRGRGDLALVRGGRGVWWQAADGLRVRLAAPKRDPAVERSRLSALALLVAVVAGSRRRK